MIASCREEGRGGPRLGLTGFLFAVPSFSELIGNSFVKLPVNGPRFCSSKPVFFGGFEIAQAS